MKFATSLFLLTILFGIIGCGANEFTVDEKEDLAYLFLAERIERGGPKEEVYFVALRYDGLFDFRPISEDLLMKFQEISPKVRNVSECTIIEGIPYLKDTDTKGVIFYIQILAQLSGGRVAIETGFYGGGLYAGGRNYIIKKSDGEWEILKTTHWMS